jgi:cell division initiation protein
VLTPQDVKNKEFTKAVFGGYDMAAVDDFLEVLAEDYSSLYKENAILKNKLKVLVEKVEEYRSTEDAMRMALLTAQKMSREIMDEATNKSKNIVEEAELAAKSKIEEIRNEVREEEQRLEIAKKATADFIAKATELYRKQLDYLLSIGIVTGLDVSEAAKPVSAAAGPNEIPNKEVLAEEIPKNLEDSIAKIYENTIRSEDAERGVADADDDNAFFGEEHDSLISDKTKVFSPASSKKEVSLDDVDEPTSPKPKFNFTNLQFGPNYDQKK